MKPQNFKFYRLVPEETPPPPPAARLWPPPPPLTSIPIITSLTMYTMLNVWKLDGPSTSAKRDEKKARSQTSHRGTVWVAGKPIPKKSKHAVRAAQIKAKSNKGRKKRKRAQQTVTVKKRLPLTKRGSGTLSEFKPKP